MYEFTKCKFFFQFLDSYRTLIYLFVDVGDPTWCNKDSNLCGEDEGDCDNHKECQLGLKCGENNCNATLGFDDDTDCCYKPMKVEKQCDNKNGNDSLCAENEGDCDLHTDCQDGLKCGYNNCNETLGYHHSVDCCYKPFDEGNETNSLSTSYSIN